MTVEGEPAVGEDGVPLVAEEGLTGSTIMPREGGDVVPIEEEKPKDLVRLLWYFTRNFFAV